MPTISIKAKLIRMQLLLALLLLTVTSVVFLINDVLILKKSVENNMVSTARILGRNLTPALAFADANEANKILSSLRSESVFSGATVFDKSGKLFAKYVASNSEDSIVAHTTDQIFQFDRGHLLTCHTLTSETEVLGQLCLDADLKVFMREYKVFFAVFALVIFAGLVTSFLFARRIQKKLSAPIERLADTAKKVSESQNYSLRMSETLSSEIEEIQSLSREFNLMLEQVEISDQKIRHEKQLAEDANKSKSVFLANISHELRTPMHGILSFAKFGQQKIDTATKEKLKSYFDEIHDSGSRLMNLLNDLLDLSKLESGKTTYSMDESDLFGVAKIIRSEMSAFAEEKGLKIELQDAENHAYAYFDQEKIGQVLRNIVSNAVKFSNKGTSIRISILQTPDQVRCTTTNFGLGIPEAELKTIFDKFVQSSKTKTGAGGTGLGLALCREIIRQHGGRIWAESDSSGKTKFIFELPIGSGKRQPSETEAIQKVV